MMPSQHRGFKFIRGFTLIEVMVVVAIVGILAAIALPSYTDYILKSRRADGISAILSLQLAQEKFRANCAGYAGKFGAFNCDTSNPMIFANNAVSHPINSSDDHYDLSIQNSTAISYTIRATAASGDDQENDKCGFFELQINLPDTNGVIQPLQKLTELGDADRCWAH